MRFLWAVLICWCATTSRFSPAPTKCRVVLLILSIFGSVSEMWSRKEFILQKYKTLGSYVAPMTVPHAKLNLEAKNWMLSELKNCFQILFSKKLTFIFFTIIKVRKSICNHHFCGSYWLLVKRRYFQFLYLLMCNLKYAYIILYVGNWEVSYDKLFFFCFSRLNLKVRRIRKGAFLGKNSSEEFSSSF